MTSLVWCYLLLNLTKYINGIFHNLLFTYCYHDHAGPWQRWRMIKGTQKLWGAGTHTKYQFVHNVALEYTTWHKRHTWKCWLIMGSDMRSLCQHILFCFLPSYMPQDYYFIVAIPFPDFLFLFRKDYYAWMNPPPHNDLVMLWTVFFPLM